jgi:hypothetical protein
VPGGGDRGWANSHGGASPFHIGPGPPVAVKRTIVDWDKKGLVLNFGGPGTILEFGTGPLTPTLNLILWESCVTRGSTVAFHRINFKFGCVKNTKRPWRFPHQTSSVRRFCMGTQGA